MEKKFKVKRFLFETKTGELVCRFMLTDQLIPMIVPNQYIEMKSINKLGTGKVCAYKICVFLNYLHEEYSITYDVATNKHVLKFVDFLIYGDLEDLKILNLNQNISYSTLTSYVSIITGFYRFIEQNYGCDMIFYEGKRKCRTQSYLYGQIREYDYEYLINRTLPRLKGRKEYIKWYTDEETQLLNDNFYTLRDKAVFLLTLEGFRVDEVLSMCLNGYKSAERLIRPTRSKMKPTAVDGFENCLRAVRISEKTAEVLNKYIYEERVIAENTSEILSNYLFLNLRGSSIGKPLAYHNYRKILKKCADRAKIDSSKIRTHSGRSSKVMNVLENNALDPKNAKSDVQIKNLFGWASIDSISPYTNHNNEILANAAFERTRKGGGKDD